MTDFAVITVAHQSERDLGRLLDSLDRLPVAPRAIVVDSGSSDGGAALARARGAETVELERNEGFGAGCNAGIERVREPVVALCNPDVELLDGGLARLAGEAAGRDALLAPRLRNTDGSVQDSAHPRPGRLGPVLTAAVPRPLLGTEVRRRLEPWRSERPVAVGWALGACLVARTELLRRLGPFDPSAFLFYEDLELCLRAARAGVPTLLRPSVSLTHHGGTSVDPAFGGTDLCLRARRRREVLAQEGTLRLALDDAEQGLTFASRALARGLAGRGGRERAQLAALLRARAGAR